VMLISNQFELISEQIAATDAGLAGRWATADQFCETSILAARQPLVLRCNVFEPPTASRQRRSTLTLLGWKEASTPDRHRVRDQTCRPLEDPLRRVSFRRDQLRPQELRDRRSEESFTPPGSDGECCRPFGSVVVEHAKNDA
jgi:hypothetical protein